MKIVERSRIIGVFVAVALAIAGVPVLAGESATGFVSFLAVTGKPGPADVSAKVEALHQRGVRSLAVYARSGLDYEYMGEDWLKTVERFCEETFRRGMKVWLYDEYNWPSGTCKGRVPRENDQWRYAEYGVFRNPDGSYRWVTALAPQGWVNVCEPAAVDRFIELTHEVYARRLKKWFDNGTVVGIFTDEPGHPTKVTFDDGKPLVTLRRYSGLEAEYEAATGRALKADVERWLDVAKTDPAAAKRAPAGEVWCVYADLMGRRFRSAYFDKIRTWCDRHGILFTGHLIAENELRPSARSNGNPVLCLRGESLPGMDEIRTAFDSSDDARIKIEWVTHNLARQAILSQGRGGMVELYACGPADHVPATLRNLLWQCACHGIDRYFSCMEVMDMRGLVEKHGYFSPTGLVHPWFEQCAREFVDEANLAATWAHKMVSEREVAVRYPRRGAALAAFAGAKTPDLDCLLGALEKNQMTCRLIDEDETTDLPLVFSCVGEDAFAEERTGRTGLSSAEAVRLCRERLPCTFEVLEEDGRPATDLLVRIYEYGAAVVVNLMPFTDRRLIAVRHGHRVPFELAGRDIRLFWSEETPPPPAERKVVQALDGQEWSLSVDADNLFRVKFDRGRVARVHVERPLKSVRLVARHYTRDYAVTDGGRPVGFNEEPPKGVKVIRHVAEPYAFTMDGQPVAATESCQSLRSGYAPLYRETPPFDLAAGEHVFEMPSGELDRNYFLPALLVAGEFAEKDGKLQPLERQGVKAGPFADVGLSGLVGSATWTTRVTVPKDLSYLRLSTGGRVAHVKLCGTDLGTRLWAPFEWQVPKALRGREGELEVRVFTSVQPMFGPAKGGDWDMKFWFGANGPDGPGGLFSVAFVTRTGF